MCGQLRRGLGMLHGQAASDPRNNRKAARRRWAGHGRLADRAGINVGRTPARRRRRTGFVYAHAALGRLFGNFPVSHRAETRFAVLVRDLAVVALLVGLGRGGGQGRRRRPTAAKAGEVDHAGGLAHGGHGRADGVADRRRRRVFGDAALDLRAVMRDLNVG